MGKLVVIEGLDGSGKATQTQQLAQRLQAEGRALYTLSFPNYQSEASALVRMYLNGVFGPSPDDVNAYAASSFYAVDRYASFMQAWGPRYKEPGTLLLADRYTTSNLIHQCAKLPRADWPAFAAWLADYEYGKLGLPPPNLVIYLDVEPAVSRLLLAQRYQKAGEKDIHEADLSYLERCRAAALWNTEQNGWRVVQCTQTGHMRPVQDIHEEVYHLLGEIL